MGFWTMTEEQTRCDRVNARVKFDKRHGKTTSDAQTEAIRLLCKCPMCAEWRKLRSATRKPTIQPGELR